MKKKIYPVVSIIFLLALWQLLVTIFHTPAFILPSPLNVLSALFADGATLVYHSFVTLEEAVIGLVIAALISFVTAIAMDHWQIFKNSLYPLLVVSQTLPIMVLGPLLALWFGFGLFPKVILVILMSYFPIVVAFSDGLSKVSSEQINFFKTMGANEWQLYRIIKIPQGSNDFFSGLKVAATYCVSGAIVGEWLSAQAGLGYYMIRVKNSYQIDKVFAAILCVIILSLLLNMLTVLLKKGYYYILYRS
ncbi:ABC transporter permease [Enterococcus durans]|uniref:ABC transporter permease n=1 Tax=Enterococcus durans TaxID=53345 RepID=UPI0020746E6D|nr:ABC transporter permease [Enterococcus durans]